MASEPVLSRAGCACPDPYFPIGEFRVAGRIKDTIVKRAHIAEHDSSRSLSSNDHSHYQLLQIIPVRRLTYRAMRRFKPGLLSPRVQHSTN